MTRRVWLVASAWVAAGALAGLALRGERLAAFDGHPASNPAPIEAIVKQVPA